MGHVKIDTNAKERSYSESYALSTPAGVKKLLRDRQAGIIGAVTLANNALLSAGLSEIQTELIALRYGVGASEYAISTVVNIPSDDVSTSLDDAVECIRIWFESKEA